MLILDVIGLFTCFIVTKASNSPCGGLLNAKSGDVKTPNYPHHYDFDETCQWIIEAPVNHIVQLTFIDFDVASMGDFGSDCLIDKVHIRNGKDASSPTLGKILCGQFTPEIVTSSGRYMMIDFTASDYSFGGRGFHAQYRTVPNDGGRSCVTNACGGVIENSPSCQVQSPGYPASFQSSLNCTWLIKAPQPNHKISFQFIELDLDETNSLCEQNSVTLRDGANANAPIIRESFCDLSHNRLKKLILKSSGPSVYMNLQTSTSSTAGGVNGFNIKFEIIDSDGNVITPSNIPAESDKSTTASTTTSLSTAIRIMTKLTSSTKKATSTKTVLTAETSVSRDVATSLIKTTSEATTKEMLSNNLTSDPAAVSGLTIGIIALVTIILMIVTVILIYRRKKNLRICRRKKSEGSLNDINKLLSSNESNGSLVSSELSIVRNL